MMANGLGGMMMDRRMVNEMDYGLGGMRMDTR